MITLFGATGYTGQKVAAALESAGLTYQLAGRSPEKLAALAQSMPSHPNWIEADVGKPATLPGLFAGAQLLINCAGPYTDLGERVLAQSAMSGTHYLDITNELGYVFRAQAHHGMAKRTGSMLVPAAGFEVALADCLANLAAKRLNGSPADPIDNVDIVYQLDGASSSAGTRRSAVRTMGTSWVAFRSGDWVGEVPSGRVRGFDLPSGRRYAFSFPSCEGITVPAHLPVRRVDVWMTTGAVGRLLAPIAIPLLARASRSVLRPLILKLSERGGKQPEESTNTRSSDRFVVYAAVRRGADLRWMSITGSDPYQVTADVIAYCARALIDSSGRSGLLAPAQAVDPQAFVDYGSRHWGWQVKEG